jgi:exodeoxyribonuclease VII large subunit
MDPQKTQTQRRIYSVSKLTKEIKALLEDNLPFVWITGEISNLSLPSSGHFYFTLKDANAQISAVMFRGQNRQLKFELTDGMQVTGLGRISVYEPRGTYQLIFELLEPKGVGALQIAFEQLKARLAAEGLFDETRKRPIPFLPEKIALITSPSGAVIHDMIRILDRRFPGVQVVILPVKVQGDAAVKEIVDALHSLREIADVEVAILARGGGAIEDLQAFNHESVARAIYAAAIPVISAVGHETDFTIADFVADLRAPTPSAAAELVVPVKQEMVRLVHALSQRLQSGFHHHLDRIRLRVKNLDRRLIDPRKKVQDFRLRLDELVGRMTRTMGRQQALRRERLDWRIERLQANKPSLRIAGLRKKLEQLHAALMGAYKSYRGDKEQALREQMAKLHALSPLAILSRGYSIARTVPDAVVVRDSNQVTINQELEILLKNGSLRVNVLENRQRGYKGI